MNIRPAQFTDMPDIMGIFDHARKFMRENGNPYQWTDGYPSEELMETEIRQGHCFVCENETDGVVATFCFSVGNDPTYSHIEGKWLNEAPYGVIHRLASNGKAKGIARQCIAWCFARHHNLRADTHADNLIMQNLLKTNGFRECGIIYTRQSPRIAYQKVTDAAPSGFQAERRISTFPFLLKATPSASSNAFCSGQDGTRRPQPFTTRWQGRPSASGTLRKALPTKRACWGKPVRMAICLYVATRPVGISFTTLYTS